MKAITKDNNAMAWGITMFLMLIAVAVITFTALGPAIEGINSAFDSDYRTEHMTETGTDTSDTLYNMYGYIIIIVLLVGLAYVVVRAISSNNTREEY